MRNKAVPPMKDSSGKNLIRVQLDYKTIITISSIEKLNNWIGRFPGAKVIAI